jgi:hypothetical protein
MHELRCKDMNKSAKTVQICFALWNYILDAEREVIDTDDIREPNEDDVLDQRPNIATNTKLVQKFFTF